jgi:hypothetical protein
VLVFFPSMKLYHARHDNIGAAVFAALFAALIYVDVQKLPFCAVVEAAMLAGLHFYPAFT